MSFDCNLAVIYKWVQTYIIIILNRIVINNDENFGKFNNVSLKNFQKIKLKKKFYKF